MQGDGSVKESQVKGLHGAEWVRLNKSLEMIKLLIIGVGKKVTE